ncbi:MAG: 16S rRNA (cytidine(1402)-2'-O)-methyltransferase [Desulfovibrio sp.]|uniref:16S rRNA (cytidine(1402)-2'-O)-methyltransferase n=1 Tax=Desulfovibrio sp. 7SRBS1 TaxID=3378064 RepID=UPI003B3F095E
MPLTSPRLWVVATPLGNPGDLSPRAKDILQQADVVLAEDTRRAGLLFQRLGLKAKGFVSFFEHNEEGRVQSVVNWLESGKDVALISDAGTPLLSDPGYRLVRACREKGLDVSPVPGPSAPMAALSACGLPPYPYTFLGFLPRSDKAVKSTLGEFAHIRTTLVFFERKSRLQSTLGLALEALGNRPCAICRELTKEHEEFILGKLDEMAGDEREYLGEITVVIAPPDRDEKLDEDALDELIAEESEAGGKPKAIARRVADRSLGWTAKAVYERMAAQKEK